MEETNGGWDGGGWRSAAPVSVGGGGRRQWVAIGGRTQPIIGQNRGGQRRENRARRRAWAAAAASTVACQSVGRRLAVGTGAVNGRGRLCEEGEEEGRRRGGISRRQAGEAEKEKGLGLVFELCLYLFDFLSSFS